MPGPHPSAPGPPTGVVVMAHGTPDTPEGIEPFYTAIRRGHRPSADQLAELTRRYRAIGGTSPLNERTAAQVDGLAAVLDRRSPGRYLVAYGTKFAEPTIEAGVASLAERGAGRAVGIVLTPHESALGSGEYVRRAGAAAAAEDPPLAFTPVRSWHRAPGLAPLLAERTDAAIAALPAERRSRPAVFFTAHSLPERALAGGDPYPDQVAESAADIAAVLELDRVPGLTWGVAWQSAGRTPEPWLGPDLAAEIRRVADEGASAVTVCPVGFVSDHLEVLFDLDIEAAGVARDAGLAFSRARSLDDDPRFLAVLADVVDAAAGPELVPPPGRAGRDASMSA